MKLPTYSTQFLACIEGDHQSCRHTDTPGIVTWVCQCECHPHDLAGPENNYDLFDPLSAQAQEILRYAGAYLSGIPKGLRRCRQCGEWRGQYLASTDPLEWHVGLTEMECQCGDSRMRQRERYHYETLN